MVLCLDVGCLVAHAGGFACVAAPLNIGVGHRSRRPGLACSAAFCLPDSYSCAERLWLAQLLPPHRISLCLLQAPAGPSVQPFLHRSHRGPHLPAVVRPHGAAVQALVPGCVWPMPEWTTAERCPPRAGRCSPAHASLRPAIPTGHRLLMDFGSSSWPDSLGWLVDRYSERGVDFFDEIWAWEVTAADHTKYWSKVPAQQRHRLHVSERWSVHCCCPALGQGAGEGHTCVRLASM